MHRTTGRILPICILGRKKSDRDQYCVLAHRLRHRLLLMYIMMDAQWLWVR